MKIIIGTNGSVRFIYSDDLVGLLGEGGGARTLRASHVEPGPSGWMANLAPVGGPFLGPFSLRQEALDAEVQWLEDHNIPIPA